jgi:hypothetical protein
MEIPNSLVDLAALLGGVGGLAGSLEFLHWLVIDVINGDSSEEDSTAGLDKQADEMIKQVGENADSPEEIVDALDGFEIQRNDGSKKSFVENQTDTA